MHRPCVTRCALFALSLVAAWTTPAARAGEPGPIALKDLPPEVRPFVAAGTRAIALERGDLNGDGRPDYVLVLERPDAPPTNADAEGGQRTLLVLVRQAGGALKEAARNDKVVCCGTCGGMMGDPFQQLRVGPNSFTVSQYGGSGWRWSVEVRFAYSRRDDRWQLVRVEEQSFHASAPDKVKVKVSMPPASFGKIDLADFDPEKWQGAGRR